MSCLRCQQLGKRPKYEKPLPSVEFYPPVAMPGQPTLKGHRLNAEHMAARAWALGIAEVQSDYDLTRGEVLVCCWWAGRWGPRRLKVALREWAEEADRHLWYSCVRVEDPPRKAKA